MSAEAMDPAAAMEAMQAMIAGLIIGMKSVQNGNFSSIVTLTILVYNTILVFPDEVDLIWRSKWSVPKVLYIFLRYYGIIHTAILLHFTTGLDVPRRTCQAYYWLVSMGGPVIFAMVVNVILTMRINALYGRNTKILAGLIVLVLAEFSFSTYVSSTTTIKTAAGVPAPMNLGFPFQGCITVVTPDHKTLLASWLVSLSVTAVFFIMTMFKLFTSVGLSGNNGRIQKRSILKLGESRAYTPLLIAFFRDGVVYYFLITAMLLASTLMTEFALPVLGSVPLPWLVGVYSFAGANLILGLRRASVKDAGGVTNWETTLSVIYFASDDTRVSRDSEI